VSERLYKAYFPDGRLVITWVEKTGEYDAPSEWRAGDMLVAHGLHENGEDIKKGERWECAGPDGSHLDFGRDCARSPQEAVDALLLGQQRAVAQAFQDYKQEKATLDAMYRASGR